jgi:hypothetical protein
MSRFAKAFAAGVIATGLFCGTAFTPVPAAAMSNRNKTILKHTKAQCKAKADKRKDVLGWLDRRKMVANCVIDALKDRPDIDPLDID